MTTYVDAKALAVVSVKGNNIGQATFFPLRRHSLIHWDFGNEPVFEGALLPLAVPEHVIWTGNIDGDLFLL